MNNQPEPDDVDLFVGGLEPSALSADETARLIEVYKGRPDYALEASEAQRILAALGIDVRNDRMPDSRSLTERWSECVTALVKPGPGGTDATDADKDPVVGGSCDPSEKAH